ncbi:MAG: hypothetical protein IJA99_00860, partial [Oscillospiraceae bacterium]|nr:hypothetical protein [Oscillospiraceae bacterium]
KRIFFLNTASKSRGRRQPYHGSFSCLMKKSIAFGCFAVLGNGFFFTAFFGGCSNTGVLQNRRESLWWKRFVQNRVNP